MAIDYATQQFKNSGLNMEDVDKNLKSFETWNEATKRMKAVITNYLIRFKNIEHTKQNSVLLSGQSGVGKSHLAKALALKLITDHKKNVIYMPYIETMNKLKQLKMEGNYIGALTKYKNSEVLFIDDLLKGKITEADISILNEIFEYRVNNLLPTIVTTEYEPEALCTIDEALGGRIYFMCKDFIITVGKNSNYNFRLRG